MQCSARGVIVTHFLLTRRSYTEFKKKPNTSKASMWEVGFILKLCNPTCNQAWAGGASPARDATHICLGCACISCFLQPRAVAGCSSLQLSAPSPAGRHSCSAPGASGFLSLFVRESLLGWGGGRSLRWVLIEKRVFIAVSVEKRLSTAEVLQFPESDKAPTGSSLQEAKLSGNILKS